ncbi:MAG: competence protein ComJ [Tepidisphaeraceae bacterium]
MPQQFTLEISYSQIAVFNPAMDRPFNNWTEDHFNQGFVWRPQSVSFRTPTRAGNVKVDVETVDAEPKLRDDAVLAISVPFHLPDSGVEIASVFKGQVCDLDPGDYQLVFQTGSAGKNPWCTFSFVKKLVKEASILKGREHLRPGNTLLMTAEPA